MDEMPEQLEVSLEVSEDDEPVDLRSRELCPDGACIGVIGPDGRCKVCGAVAVPQSAEVVQSSGDPHAENDGDLDAEGADLDAEEDGDPPDLSVRKLCSDGSCIGVIGSDDCCKVCGKPYAGEPAL